MKAYCFACDFASRESKHDAWVQLPITFATPTKNCQGNLQETVFSIYFSNIPNSLTLSLSSSSP